MKNVDKNDKIMDPAPGCAAIRHSSFLILLGLFCLLFPAKSFAQTGNRWLLVFNTSAAMRDRAQGIQAVTHDLLTSGMHGTMRPGDTLGIWTYSSELRADEAPLLNWYPDVSQGIAEKAQEFLSRHPYEKTAAFGNVMANMLRVITNSDVITVVLVSDGSDPIKGTPFDAHIENYYKANFQPQRKARMPMVTVFRGQKGVITTNTLALAPWPVDIPATPPPVIAKASVQKPAPVAPPKPVPSLVIIGKKAETTFNVPTDLPDHSGELAPQPVAAPPPA
jgi:hypothetical protein